LLPPGGIPCIGVVAKALNTASVGLPSRVTGKFNPIAVFANSSIPGRNCPLADISVVGWRKGFGRVMHADHVEVSWDADKSNWMVRIKSGEEVALRGLFAVSKGP
jgi:hypothetical protein